MLFWHLNFHNLIFSIVLTIENVVIHTRPLTGEQLAECFYIQNPLYNQLHMEHQTEEQFQIALVGVGCNEIL